MTWKVLVTTPNATPVLGEYRRRLTAAGCDVVAPAVNERLSEEQLALIIGDVDGIICGDDEITERVLNAAGRLKIIVKWGTGMDSIDVQAAGRRGIPVKNTPNAFTEPVADTVFAHLLTFARQPDFLDRGVRLGHWPKPQLHSLGERRLGVIGTGNIGRAVVRRALAFGMSVVGHDNVPPPEEFVRATGIEMVPIGELLETSDYITLHLTLSPSTFHIIDENALRRMKRTAILVNTARGKLVDEVALVKALREGWIAGAALDVYESEPLPASSLLRKIENVRLGSHHANSSGRAAELAHEASITQLIEGLGRAAAWART